MSLRSPGPRLGLPGWAFIPAGIGITFVVLPLVAMVLRVDWTNFWGLITSEASRDALSLSLRTSTASTIACVVLGVPMALVLARTEFRGQNVVRSLVLLPLVLPPVVGGIALLYTFGRRGLLGQTFEAMGIQIAFTTLAVVLAQTFVALPFLVVSVEGSLRTAGERYEVVAASLGATPSTVFRRVTLPLIAPGLASGAVLAFARSLGEFGATITFAGSLQGVTRTLSLEIFKLRETDVDAAVALSLGVGRGRRRRDRTHPAESRQPMSLEFDATVAERGLEAAFTVGDGETVALLGPNGAGKSTILAIIAGLLTPDVGHVRLAGRNLTEVTPDQRGQHPGRSTPPRDRSTGPGPTALPPPHGARERGVRAPMPAYAAKPGTRSGSPLARRGRRE